MKDDLLGALPQKGPALLLTEPLEVSDTSARARAHLSACVSYATDRGIHALVSIELIAQCAALTRATPGQTGGAGGVLAAIPELRVRKDYLQTEDQVVVTVTRKESLGHLLRFDGQVADESGRELAAGTIVIAEESP